MPMKLLISLPLYPLLYLIGSPLRFYADNALTFELFHAVRAALVLLAVGAAFLLALRFVLRGAATAGYALFMATIAIMFIGPDPVMLAIWACLAVLLGRVIAWLGLARNATVIANVVTLSLLVLSVFQIVAAERFLSRNASEPLPFGPLADAGADAVAVRGQLPSVAHIVLDGYGSTTALRQLFDFDNTPHLDALRELGFLVFEDVPVPFNQTLLSMSAVMNADYPPLGEPPLQNMSPLALRMVLSTAMLDSAVSRIFRDQGHTRYYSVAKFGSFPFPRDGHVISAGQPSFSLAPFDVHFLAVKLRNWGELPLSREATAAPHKAQTKLTLSPDIIDNLSPAFFLYSHVLTPHPPLIANRDGRPMARWRFSLMSDGDHGHGSNPVLQSEYREGYIGNIQSANGAVRVQVSRMIEEIDGPLVIVIHGDHGGGLRLAHESADQTCLMERMRTTVAIYTNVPEIRAALEQQGISNIVNIYRVILSPLLDQPLEPLEGQYFAKWSDPAHPASLAGMDFNRNCD
jgi:hypothetical protein